MFLFDYVGVSLISQGVSYTFSNYVKKIFDSIVYLYLLFHKT